LVVQFSHMIEVSTNLVDRFARAWNQLLGQGQDLTVIAFDPWSWLQSNPWLGGCIKLARLAEHRFARVQVQAATEAIGKAKGLYPVNTRPAPGGFMAARVRRQGCTV